MNNHMTNDTAVPEEIEDEESESTEERTWRDYDDDGQLITGRDVDGSWY